MSARTRPAARGPRGSRVRGWGPRCAALAGLLLGSCGGAETSEGPRGLIVISLDTFRADHLSLYGYERDTTPRLDELARESVVFDQAYTTAPWTQPAHMSLLTGLYPMQHRVIGRDRSLGAEARTLAERLRDVGFRTAAFYRPGWIQPHYGFDRGFDVFEPHRDGAEADREVQAWVDGLDDGERFFLFVHLFDAHNVEFDRPDVLPYETPGRFPTLFLDDAKERLRGVSARGIWQGTHPTTPEEFEAVVALYDGGLRYVDHLVGSWVRGWRESGLLDDAALIVTADHGEALGTRNGGFSSHGKMWEEGLRIPLLVRAPGASGRGTRRDEPVSLVDVAPTVSELFGLPRDGAWLGHSLLGEERPRLAVVAQQPTWSVGRVGDYKLLHTYRGDLPERLYDLAADPGERAPLAEGEHPDVHERVKGELGELLTIRSPYFQFAAKPGEAQPLSAEEERVLEALGYGGD